MNSKKSEVFVKEFMKYVKSRDPHQPEFHQAVNEVIETLADFITFEFGNRPADSKLNPIIGKFNPGMNR